MRADDYDSPDGPADCLGLAYVVSVRTTQTNKQTCQGAVLGNFVKRCVSFPSTQLAS
jgi:hypothetical protein